MDSLYPGQQWQSAKSRHLPHSMPPLCRLSLAVVLAAAGLPAENARAEGCERRTTVLGGVSHAACVLDSGEQLQVTGKGKLSVSTGPAVSLAEGATARQVLNKGMISGNDGILVANARLSGTLFNAALGEVRGSHSAVTVSNSTVGAFANAGTLSTAGPLEDNTSAVAIINSTVNHDFNNSGTVTVDQDVGYTGIYLSGDLIKGDFKNGGTIDGRYYGLLIEKTRVEGSFNNSGTITAGSALLVSASSFGGDFINSGLIDSTFSLRDVSIGGSFINTGGISGLDSAYIQDSHIAGDVINTGVFAASSGAGILANIEGSLINTGLMWGGAYSVDISGDIKGGIYNSGTIAGGLDFSSGVYLDAHTPTLVNTGEIWGFSGGLVIGGRAHIGTLINSGTISGYESSLAVSENAFLGSVHIVGAHARFEGPVDAPTVPFYVDKGATYRLLAEDALTIKSLNNHGTLVLAPPDNERPGPSTITGDFKQVAGGVLRTEVTDTTHYGQLVVSGTATLPAHARIEVELTQATLPLEASRLQDVLSAGRLVSDGSFTVSSNSTLFNFAAVKDGNTLDLTLATKAANGVQGAAQALGMRHAAAAARVIDQQLAKGSNSALTPYFVSATSTAEVASALTQTLPSGNASLRASQAALGEITQALQDRLVPINHEAPNLQPAPTLWSKPFTSLANGTAGSSGGSGQVIGMDTRVSATQRVGLAFAYANGTTQGDALGSGRNSQLDLWQFTGYSAYTLAPDTELMLYAGAGHNRVQGKRSLALSGVSGDAKGEFDSLVATVGASLGHAYTLNERTRLVPSLRLDYSLLRDDAYREQGSGAIAPLLLSVDERQTSQLIAGLDGRLEHQFSAQGASLRIDLGVGMDLIHTPDTVTARFAGAPDYRFETRSEQASPWLVRGGLSLVTPLNASGAELTVNYSTQVRSDYTDEAATVAVKVPF